MSKWNRIDDACCVHCGAPLLSMKESSKNLLMCTECLKNVKMDAIGKIKHGSPKRRIKIKLPTYMISDEALKKAKKKR